MDYELPWGGTAFEAPVIAFDTETEVAVDKSLDIQKFVLMSVSDGQRTAIVFPDQLGKFISAHRYSEWVGWNVAFDWWVIEKELRLGRLYSTIDYTVWWDVASDRLFDLMLLEQLYRLGIGEDALFFPISLKLAVSRYLQEEMGKDADIRLCYKRRMTQGSHWQDVDRAFWDYAAKDALKTFEVGQQLGRRIDEEIFQKVPPQLMVNHFDTSFDLLTCGLQTRAALALDQVQRNGFGVDQALLKERLDQEVKKGSELTARITQNFPEMFKRDKKGQAVFTKKTLMPSTDLKELRNYLLNLALQRNLRPPMTEKTGEMNSSAEWWGLNAGDDPFVQDWVKLVGLGKRIGFLEGLRGKDSLHSRYTTIVRTGRTSASPNIQNVEKGESRKLFRARPGNSLVIVDYSAIELKTLAAVIERRWGPGSSVLAKVLREGRDPHSYTASLVLKVPYDQVVLGVKKEKALAKEHPGEAIATPYSEARQAAKAINFGVPGGLGAHRLMAYAEANYGVKMDLGRARELRATLIGEVYPELTRWLEDSISERLAVTLGVPPGSVDRALGINDRPFGDPADHPAARVVRGDRVKKKGGQFSDWYVEGVWVALDNLLGESPVEATPTWVRDSIRTRRSGADLHDYLFCVPCVTTTGRVRKKTFYGDYRNTQFQGLAADGAKAALWELTQLGYKIVAFIHDEVVVECPTDVAEDTRKAVEQVMVQAFQKVMPVDIPVTVEGGVNERWVK